MRLPSCSNYINADIILFIFDLSYSRIKSRELMAAYCSEVVAWPAYAVLYFSPYDEEIIYHKYIGDNPLSTRHYSPKTEHKIV